MALHFEQVSLAALPANLLAAPAIAPVMWLGVLAGRGGAVAAPLATPFTALTAPLLVYLQAVAHVTARDAALVGRARTSPPAVDPAAWAALLGVAALPSGVAPRDGARLAGPRCSASRRTARRGRRRSARAALGAAPPARGWRRGLRSSWRPRASSSRCAAPPRRRCAGRARGLVPRRRPGRRDADPARRDVRARRHRPARRADPEAPERGRTSSGWTRCCSPTPRPTTRAPRRAVIARVRPAAGRRRRRRLGLAGPARAARRAGGERSRAVAPRRARRSTSARLRFAVLWPPARRRRAERQPERPRDRHAARRHGDSRCCSPPTPRATSRPLAPRAGRRPQGRPPRQRRPRTAGAARAPDSRGSPRSRSAATTRYGHPTKSTLAGAAGDGPTVVRTDRDGTVRLRVDGDRLRVQR